MIKSIGMKVQNIKIFKLSQTDQRCLIFPLFIRLRNFFPFFIFNLSRYLRRRVGEKYRIWVFPRWINLNIAFVLANRRVQLLGGGDHQKVTEIVI